MPSSNSPPETKPTAPQVLCELRNVGKVYPLPNGTDRVVLENITLAVQPEEVVALLGPSGCGKSTIMRIMAGLIEKSNGEVLYHDQPLAGLNPGVAIVFQSFALYPWMTVTENVQAVLQAINLPEKEVEDRAEKAIRLVGLAGFEEAYPRELSGGMKQRVGMARALSVDPEILMLDEPFSQVDALTAESLRAEVTDIWSAKNRHPSSILMVSHDIKEVAFMADRIVILGANPGRIQTIVENKMPRPRDYRSPEFNQLVDHLHELITGHELPDVPEPGLSTAVESLPEAAASQIVGLLEYLDARGGKEDVFKIANDTQHEFGKMIQVVEAAELLGLVETPRRMVLISRTGHRFLLAQVDDRKKLWREQLLRLRLFKLLHDVLIKQPEHELETELVYETIVLHLPQENYETTFETLVRWARYGNLFAYDEDRQIISLQEDVAPTPV